MDAVSLALRERDKVKLKQLPRMADFVTWVVRLEKVKEQPSALSVDTKKITQDNQGESKTDA